MPNLTHANTYFWTQDEDKYLNTTITSRVILDNNATVAENNGYGRGDWFKDPSFSKPYNFPYVRKEPPVDKNEVLNGNLEISIDANPDEDRWHYIPYLNLIFSDGSSMRFRGNSLIKFGNEENSTFKILIPISLMQSEDDSP